MKWLRRFFGLLACLLSLAGFIACVAAAIGMWAFSKDATQRIERLAEQVDLGLGQAASATQTISRSIETIRNDVASVTEFRNDLEEGKDRNRIVTVYLRTVTQRLRTFADSVARLTGIIRNVPEFVYRRGDSTETGIINQAAARSVELLTAVERLQTLLGGEGNAVQENDLISAATMATESLDKCESLLDDVRKELDSAKKDLTGRKVELLRQMRTTAIAATCVIGWVAFSQLCLFVVGWRWVRR